jgi:hypothetical protein
MRPASARSALHALSWSTLGPCADVCREYADHLIEARVETEFQLLPAPATPVAQRPLVRTGFGECEARWDAAIEDARSKLESIPIPSFRSSLLAHFVDSHPAAGVRFSSQTP